MPAREKIRGLVFDKDGTLFDFNATWAAWCDGFILGLAAGNEVRAGLQPYETRVAPDQRVERLLVSVAGSDHQMEILNFTLSFTTLLDSR